MKKPNIKQTLYHVIVGAAIVTYSFMLSCNKELNYEKVDMLTFNDLTVVMPEGHSESELYLTKDDYKQKLKTATPSLKSGKVKIEYPLRLMASLCEKVLQNYPLIDSIIEFDKIRLNFPELSDEQIMNNIGTIDSFYNCLIRYDLAKEISKSDLKKFLKDNETVNKPRLKSSSDYFGTGLNQDEFWFIFWHARFAIPIETATLDAIDFTDSYFAGYDQAQDIADAYRHAVWNALICKESAPKKEWVSECQSIAKGFTDAHETGATTPSNFTEEEWAIDQSMDYHNNSVGRYYFGTVASSYKKCTLCNRYVKCPSSETIAADVHKYLPSAIKVAFETVSGYSNTRLVYFK